MSTPRKTTSDKPSNMYHTAIPGGIAADGAIIKAGSAAWWKPEELPPRKKRPLDVAGVQYSGALDRAAKAQPAKVDGEGIPDVEFGGKKIDGESLAIMAAIADDDIATIFELNDMSAWAYLKSWTLQRERTIPGRVEGETTYPEQKVLEPYPLPETPDDLLDLPRATYDALLAASAKIYAEARAAENGFGVDSAPNPASPIAASGA